MNRIATERLELRPFAAQDFESFVTTMLTDPCVVEFYFSYKVLTDINEIRDKARKDFWDYFESSRDQHGFDFESQITAYGSDDMYLYRKTFWEPPPGTLHLLCATSMPDFDGSIDPCISGDGSNDQNYPLAPRATCGVRGLVVRLLARSLCSD